MHYHSENHATSQIWKILPNMAFSPHLEEKRRRSEHAHASYPGLFFRPPGFSLGVQLLYGAGRKESSGTGLCLAQLSENPVSCVCGRSLFVCEARKFFQRCILETIFSPEEETLKSYKSKGICSIALKSLKKRESLREFYRGHFCLGYPLLH